MLSHVRNSWPEQAFSLEYPYLGQPAFVFSAPDLEQIDNSPYIEAGSAQARQMAEQIDKDKRDLLITYLGFYWIGLPCSLGIELLGQNIRDDWSKTDMLHQSIFNGRQISTTKAPVFGLAIEQDCELSIC